MSLFDTKFKPQVTNYLPPVLRGSSIIDYLSSLVYPLEQRLLTDKAFETDINNRLRYNGQKIKMQAAINEIMGVVSAPYIIIVTRQTFVGLPQLVLDESEPGSTMLVFDEAEGGNTLIIDESEEVADQDEFEVQIPVGLSNTDFDAKVEAEINKLKVAGTRFNITTY